MQGKKMTMKEAQGYIMNLNNKLMNFESELPNDFKKMLDLLNKLSN